MAPPTKLLEKLQRAARRIAEPQVCHATEYQLVCKLKNQTELLEEVESVLSDIDSNNDSTTTRRRRIKVCNRDDVQESFLAAQSQCLNRLVAAVDESSFSEDDAAGSNCIFHRQAVALLLNSLQRYTSRKCRGLERLRFSIVRTILQLGSGLGEDEYDLPRQLLQIDPSLYPEVCHYCTHTDKKGIGLVSILYASLSDASLRHVVAYALANLPETTSEMQVLHRARLLSEAALSNTLELVTDTYWYDAATRVTTTLMGLVSLARKSLLSAYAPLLAMKTLAQVDPTILAPDVCWIGLIALSSASIMERDEALSVIDVVLTGYCGRTLYSDDVWSLKALVYPLYSLMTTSEAPTASRILSKLEELPQCNDVNCGTQTLNNYFADCPGRPHPSITAPYIYHSMLHQLSSGKLIKLCNTMTKDFASSSYALPIAQGRFLVISPCLTHRDADVRFSAVETAVTACESNPLVGVSILPLLLRRIGEWNDSNSLRAKCLRQVCLAGRHRIVAKQIYNYIDNLGSHQNPCNLIVLGLTVRMKCILASVNSWMIPQLEGALALALQGGGGSSSSSFTAAQASLAESKAMRLAVAASLRDFCEFNAEAALDHIRLLQNGLSDPLPEVVHLCLEGLAAMVRQDCLDFLVVLRIIRKRGNVAHYDMENGVGHPLVIEGIAHLCGAAEEAWTKMEEVDKEEEQPSIFPHTFDVISWLWEMIALFKRRQGDEAAPDDGSEQHQKATKCCFDALGLLGVRITRVSAVEGKDDAYAQLQDVRSEMTRKMIQYLYHNCHSIICTKSLDMLSLTEALGNMVDIECDDVKTHFRSTTSAAQPRTKLSSGPPLVGEGMDSDMPSSESLLKAYDDASANEQCNSMAGAIVWCRDRRSMTCFADFIADEGKAFMRPSPYCVKLMIVTGIIRYTESWWDAGEHDRNVEACLEELEHLEKDPLGCLSQTILACHLENVHDKRARLEVIMKRISSLTDDREPITDDDDVLFGWDCLDPICAALIAASLPIGHAEMQNDVRLLLQHQFAVNNQRLWYCVGIALLTASQSKSNQDSRPAIICCGELLALIFSDDDAAVRKDFQEEWLRSTPDETTLLEMLRCSSSSTAAFPKEKAGKFLSIISSGIEIISWVLPVFHRKLLLSLLRVFLAYPGVSCVAQAMANLSLMCGKDDAAPPLATLLNEVYDSHAGDKFVGLALLAAADLQSHEGKIAAKAVRIAAQNTEASDEFDLAALSLAVLCCGPEATWSGTLNSFFIDTTTTPMTSPLVASASKSFIHGVVRDAQTISSRHRSRSRRGVAWRTMGCIAASIAVSGGGVSSSSSSSMHHVEFHLKRGLKLKLPAEETLSCQLLEIVFSSVEEMEQKRINGTDYKYVFPAVMIAMKSLSRGADRLRTSTSAMVKLLDNLMKLIEGMGGDWGEEEAVLQAVFAFTLEAAKRRDGSPFVSWFQSLLPQKCLELHPRHKELLLCSLPKMIYTAFPTNSIFSALNATWEAIRDDPVASVVLAFTRGLVDTIIISSQQEQRISTPDYSLLRDFSFSVVSVVISTHGLFALDSLLALPMEDWHFSLAKLKDKTAIESRLLLKAAGQGFWWRQGGGMDRILRWLTSSSPEALQYIDELCPMLTQAVLKTWPKDAEEVKHALLVILEGESPSKALSAFVKSWSLDALLFDTDHSQQHDDIGVCTELATIDCDDIGCDLASKALRFLGFADPSLRSQMRHIIIGLRNNVSSGYSPCFSLGCLLLLKDQCCCNNGP